MAYGLVSGGGESDGRTGYTYATVLVRDVDRAEVLAALAEVRFSGWVGLDEDGWVVAVAARGGGAVAAGRRGVVDVAGELAGRLGGTVLAVRVLGDRQLLLVGWVAGAEVGRYVSDPSHGLGPEDDTLPEPIGVEHAEGFAAACGRPEAAEELAELLAEELDPENVIESERLVAVARLLGLPAWLVSVSSLPRDVPAGPRAGDFTRLGAGSQGAAGRIRGRAAELVRGRRPPASPVPDAPHRGPDIDPWLL